MNEYQLAINAYEGQRKNISFLTERAASLEKTASEALQECERLRGSYQRGEAHAWTQAAQIIEAQDSMQGWKRRIAMLFRDNADGAISRALSKGE